MSEVRLSADQYQLTAQQKAELQKELSAARSKDDREKIFINFVQSNNIQAKETPTSVSVEDGAAAATQSEQLAKKVVADKDEIKKLPPEYQELYYMAGEDEAMKKKVILQYFGDSKYFPEQETVVTTGGTVFGNRNSKLKEGGFQFAMESTKDPLVDGDGKPIKESVEKRFDTVKTKFMEVKEAQLSEVDANPTLSAEQKAKAKEDLLVNEALNSSWKPQVKELAENLKKNTPTSNKNTYYNLAMTQDEKNAVNTRANAIREDMKALINKPEAELTAEDKAKLEQYKKDFNAKFTEEEAFKENEHLWDLNKVQNPKVKAAAYDKLDALAKIMAIEEQIASEQKSTGSIYPTGELSDEQRTKLAKAQMRESITHENEILDLSQERILTKDKDRLDVIDKKIKVLSKNKDKMLDDIKKGLVADQAQAQVEFETYKQNYDNTTVHWSKKQAKDAEKDNPAVNNTHLNKYAQEIIKKNPSAFCDQATADSHDFETTDENGNKQYWSLNSDSYKKEMLRLSNSQSGFDDTKLDGDYYVSTSEWADFADKHAKKGEGRPATMGERSDAREMFEAAGLQVSKDRTYAMRAKEIAKAGAIGAGGGALAALGGELLNLGKNLNYNGTAYGIAKGIASTTINGIASTTISGIASTTVNGVANGTVTGVATDTITGTAEGTVSGTATSIHESIVQKYDPNTGKYITVGHQVTEVPVDWSKDVALDYSKDVSIAYKQDVSIAYEQQVDIPYEQQVDIPYEKKVDVPYEQKDVPAEYKGHVDYKFDWGNIAKAGGIGAAMGVATKGLQYLFKKKDKDDYVSDDTAKDAIRSNTGYEQKQETVVVTPADRGPVMADTRKEVTEQQTETKEIPQFQYKLKAGETIGAVICGKYGVKIGSPEYKAILNYVRTTANGLKPGEIPMGDKYNLPEWIPGDVLGKDDNVALDKDGNVAKTNYRKVAYKGRNATNSGTYQHTTTTHRTVTGSDIWNPDGTKRKK